VVEHAGDVLEYGYLQLGIISQTTMPERRVAELRDLIAARNPHAEIRFVDTVCLPTKEHQRALERLIESVDAVVVVGGRNSNNTLELVARCRERARPVFHVQSADELDADSFRGFAKVGLTAGTSTLRATVDEVHRALVRISSTLEERPEGNFEECSLPVVRNAPSQLWRGLPTSPLGRP
jgi:4-hydroxy-3-methylbut-2-enyl diphosphate reductase